jgi:hypothetical protein
LSSHLKEGSIAHLEIFMLLQVASTKSLLSPAQPPQGGVMCQIPLYGTEFNTSQVPHRPEFRGRLWSDNYKEVKKKEKEAFIDNFQKQQLGRGSGHIHIPNPQGTARSREENRKRRGRNQNGKTMVTRAKRGERQTKFVPVVAKAKETSRQKKKREKNSKIVTQRPGAVAPSSSITK